MKGVRFSRRADADLEGIDDYTARTWGVARRDRYMDDLEKWCKRVAANPGLGRACNWIRPRYRRLEHGQHVIFYLLDAQGILVVRVLHKSMIPQHHFTPQDQTE